MQVVTLALAGCAAVLIATAPVLAQKPPVHEHPSAAVNADAPAPGMAAKCHALMDEHEKATADANSVDRRLDRLIATMTAASGTEKMAATTEVIAELVSQHRTMRDAAMRSRQSMMSHMMEHMQAGKQSMATCPMMKQMDQVKP